VDLERRIRLLGVRVGGLVHVDAVTPVVREPDRATAPLFD
jgi:hypothetical protein